MKHEARLLKSDWLELSKLSTQLGATKFSKYSGTFLFRPGDWAP